MLYYYKLLCGTKLSALPSKEKDNLMSEPTTLDQVQKRIYQLTNFEDGFWDLLLGTIFMLLAFYPLTREALGPEWNVALFLVALILLTGTQLALRNFVSGPRIGYVKGRHTPRLKQLMIFTFLMVMLTFGLLLATLLGTGSEIGASTAAASSSRGYTVELIVVLVTGGLFTAMGYIFGVTRLYFYGWLMGLANLASVYMTHTAGWSFNIPLAVLAGSIMLIGAVLLRRFLRKYPARDLQA
jgi:hypothetical protein